jgi:hypothetical protein
LVIGISVAIGKEQEPEWWSGGVVEKNKGWSAGLRLRESTGVLGLRAEIDLIFTLLPLVMRDPNMVCIFP